MFLKLFMLFTLAPALEIYLIIKVGQSIGAFNTLLIILATGALGAYYARQQGVRTITDINRRMTEGVVPGAELINGAMLLIGGALLLTPGFITDALGFSLIFPLTRDLIKARVRVHIERKIERGEINVYHY